MPAPEQIPVTSGFHRGDGLFVPSSQFHLLPPQTFAAGQTIGKVHDLGFMASLRCLLAVTAKAGSNPTLDVSIQTSEDGVNDWRVLGSSLPLPAATAPTQTFLQCTDVGLALTAVTESGTTPPDIAFTGTPLVPINFRAECTTGGARGTAVIRTSIDGGISWVESILSAATIPLTAPDGSATGVTLTYENVSANVDNVWRGRTAGQERRVLNLLGRYVRAVARVGGTGGPTMTASLLVDVVRP